MTALDRNSMAEGALAYRRTVRYFSAMLTAFACLTVLPPSPAAAQSTTALVRLKLVTGGRIEGGVLDHNEHGLVVVADNTPFVLAWIDIEAISSVAAKFAIIEAARGGRDKVTAGDYFDLGLYALTRNHSERASTLFRAAKRLDPSLAEEVRRALTNSRKRGARVTRSRAAAPSPTGQTELDPEGANGLAEQIEDALHDRGAREPMIARTPQHIRDQVMKIYRTFGKTVQEVLGKRVVAIETDHFLIWTDWPKFDHETLTELCEAMYSALCREFGISTTAPVFLAKCPLFCFESKARFLKFARTFDGYDGKEAIGYTRSIERNGHVHMALMRQGRTEEDFDRFACTLVHEGTHAFVHRLYTPRLIPNWVNEGLAELMAEKVLKDRCPTAEKAQLLAAQYIQFDWPVKNLVRSAGPIDVHQYAIAHSLIAYLASRGEKGLRGFIHRLKDGDAVAAALAGQYDGLTLDGLEQGWRAWVGTRSNLER